MTFDNEQINSYLMIQMVLKLIFIFNKMPMNTRTIMKLIPASSYILEDFFWKDIKWWVLRYEFQFFINRTSIIGLNPLSKRENLVIFVVLVSRLNNKLGSFDYYVIFEEGSMSRCTFLHHKKQKLSHKNGWRLKNRKFCIT